MIYGAVATSLWDVRGGNNKRRRAAWLQPESRALKAQPHANIKIRCLATNFLHLQIWYNVASLAWSML